MQLILQSPAAIHLPVRRSRCSGWWATEESPAASVLKKQWCELNIPALHGPVLPWGARGKPPACSIRGLHPLSQYPKIPNGKIAATRENAPPSITFRLGSYSDPPSFFSLKSRCLQLGHLEEQLVLGSPLPPALLLKFPWQILRTSRLYS